MSGPGVTGRGDDAGGPGIGVALKLAAGRIEVDPLTGEVTPDRVPGGTSRSGLAALEIALRLRDAWHATVTVATLGTVAAEPMLRDALAMGADRAIRIEAPRREGAAVPAAPGTPPALAAAAMALAGALAGCPIVLCGDGGHDGATGAVPALLAAYGGRAQALGLISVAPAGAPGTVRAERRLDRGWRERLLVRPPMVLSVESGSAQPRRAPMGAMLAARNAAVSVLPWPAAGAAGAAIGDPGGTAGTEPAAPAQKAGITVLPYRPRARVLPPPAGESPLARVRSLLGTDGQAEPPERVDAEPAAAARQILAKLRSWGYL
jgi:electron transfer flavoprotein beta subunit